MDLRNTIKNMKKQGNNMVLSFTLFLFPAIIFAGNTASHTVTIRIIGVNSFQMDQISQQTTAQNRMQVSGQSGSESEFNMHWRFSNPDKRLTVSSSANTQKPGHLLINNNRKLQLTPTSRDIGNIIKDHEGECRVIFCKDEKQTEPVQLIYTLTDI